MSNEIKNIYQRINAVMKKVKYVKRDPSGFGGSKGVKYDVVIAELRSEFIEQGIVFTQSQVGQTVKIADLPTKNGGVQLLYSSTYKNRLTNMNDPSDFIEGSITAHSTDSGDKAPGKTSTYSAKVFLVKAFSLESGDDEESRSDIDDRVKGNLQATAIELANILEKLNQLSEEKRANALTFFNGKLSLTEAEIRSGQLSQVQAFSIDKALEQSLNKSNG